MKEGLLYCEADEDDDILYKSQLLGKVAYLSDRNLKTIRKKYRVDSSKICFIKFILEAYEGMAQLTTLNPRLGLIEIFMAPGCAEDVEKIILDLKQQMLIEVWSIPGKNTSTNEK